MSFRKIKNLFVVLFSLLMLPGALYAADSYYEQKLTSRFLSSVTNEVLERSVRQVVYIKDNKMRVEEKKSGNGTIILLEKKIVQNYNKAKKTYAAVDFLSLEMVQRRLEYRGTQFAPMMQSAMQSSQKGLLDTLEWMPEERRSFMQDRMGQQISIMKNMQGNVPNDPAKSVVEVTYSDDSVKINGFDCYKVEILENKKPVHTSWMTNDITLPPNFRRFDNILFLFKSKVSSELKKLKGFPIKETTVLVFDSMNKIQRTREVTSYTEKYLKDTDFEPPLGYMKVDSESFKPF